MENNYIYPHVNMTTKAMKRRVPAMADSNATTLLAPFTCDRGPENVLVPVDTLADFERYFGELDYSKLDQRQILNIGNWITNGGRVLACRITDYDEKALNSICKKANSKVETDVLTDRLYLVESSDEELTKKSKAYAKYSSIERSITTTTQPVKKEPEKITEKEGHADILGEDGRVTQEHEDGIIRIVNATTYNTIEKYYMFGWKAKYSGSYYNDISVEISQVKPESNIFNVIVKKNNNILERYSNKKATQFYTIENVSEYISELALYEIKKTIETTEKINIKQTIYYNSEGPTGLTHDDSEAYSEDNGTTYGKPEMDIREAALEDSDVFIQLDTTEDQYVPGSGYNILPLFSIGGKKDTINLGTDFDITNWFETFEPTESDDIHHGKKDSHLYISLKKILKQPLETPFDTFIDVGYSGQIKNELIDLFCNGVTNEGSKLVRDDAFLILSDIEIKGTGTRLNDVSISDISKSPSMTNAAVFTQYEKITDLFSKVSGKEVYVPTTYFMAGLYPYNDIVYGPQYPSAGLTRGVIKNALWIDSIPTNYEKNELYKANKNYIEKDSRGQYVMTQLTHTSDDTALKFINNSRSLLKMKRELEKLSRRYLHEFNDRITKTNLLNALNASLSNWIQNRTLSYGSISLQDYTENEFLTNEELLIQLDIKFTGTIEVISIEFTVE